MSKVFWTLLKLINISKEDINEATDNLKYQQDVSKYLKVDLNN